MGTSKSKDFDSHQKFKISETTIGGKMEEEQFKYEHGRFTSQRSGKSYDEEEFRNYCEENKTTPRIVFGVIVEEEANRIRRMKSELVKRIETAEREEDEAIDKEIRDAKRKGMRVAMNISSLPNCRLHQDRSIDL